MFNRTILRVALSLLVTAAQVAGVGMAAAPTRTPDTGAYFCCCVGTCSPVNRRPHLNRTGVHTPAAVGSW